MTYDDTKPTKEILKARRRADYQRHKEAMHEQRARLKQSKDKARKQQKDQHTAQLRALIKPATTLAEEQQATKKEP